MRYLSIILFVCFLSVFSTAQTNKSAAQKLDDYFTALAKKGEINGRALIAENGKVVYEKSFGYADVEARKLNTKDTEFQLASIAKTFTAIAVLQLKEKGKLGLDDKFVKHFPDFPYPEITIRHLLSHTSGLPDYELFDKLIKENPDRVFENKDIIPAMKQEKQTVVVLDNASSAGLYRKGLSALNILNAKPTLPVKRSLARIYGRALTAKDAHYAAVRLNELKADTENYNLSEDEFNNIAYDMMFNGFKEQALENFKINTFLFPASDNIYESYGDALLSAGKKEEAIIMFKKALQINPDNKPAKENFKKAESVK